MRGRRKKCVRIAIANDGARLREVMTTKRVSAISVDGTSISRIGSRLVRVGVQELLKRLLAGRILRRTVWCA